MNRHDGASARRDGFFKGVRIERERVRINIGENRHTARVDDGERGVSGGERRSDDFIATSPANRLGLTVHSTAGRHRSVRHGGGSGIGCLSFLISALLATVAAEAPLDGIQLDGIQMSQVTIQRTVVIRIPNAPPPPPRRMRFTRSR